MMKFFRKHNKKLLAIFMALLMIVFIGGTALESMLRPSFDRVAAESRFGKITQSELLFAEESTRILENLGLPWRQPLPSSAEPLEIADWVLLTREAASLGVTSQPTSVRATLGDIDVRQIARLLQKKPQRILRALAEWDSIVNTAQTMTGSGIPSEAELRTAVADVLHQLKVNVVLLPAEMFLDESPAFPQERIESHFTAYRDRRRGPGLQFGYYLEPAIRVQYIKIDLDALAETVRVANLEHKAHTYFDENRDIDPVFHRPHEQEDDAQDVDHQDHLMDWEEARPHAIAAVRRREAQEIAPRIANWLAQYTTEPWLDMERGPDGYRSTPEVVATDDYYQQVIESLPPTLAYPTAMFVGLTDSFTQDEADAVPGIGKARYLPPGSFIPLTLRSVAFQNKFMVPEIPNDRGVNPADYLAPFQTCRYPLRDNEGHLYVIRVVDFREGQSPDTVDVVRDRVIDDLRLHTAYETALWRAESLRSCSDDDLTLQEAFESDTELLLSTTSGAGYFEVSPFPRRTRVEAASGKPHPTTYLGPGIGSVSHEVIDRLFTLARTGQPTAVVELKDRAAVMVVEFVDLVPPAADEFYSLRDEIHTEALQQRAQALAGEWLDPDNVRARTGFRLVTN